jgi:hypothetical protein
MGRGRRAGSFWLPRRQPPAALASTALVLALLGGCSASPGGPTPSTPAGSSSATASASGASRSPDASSTAQSTPAPADAIEDIAPAEGSLNAVWIGPDVVVAGGALGAAGQPTIVRFEGGSWTNADVPTEWAGERGQVMGIAEAGGVLFAVGNGLPDDRRGFVWSSTDRGATWQNSLTEEAAAFYDVAASGNTVYAVGAHLNAEMRPTAVVFLSPDRETWDAGQVESATGQAMGSITTTAEGFAAIGTGATSSGGDLTVWRSTDGRTWNATVADLPPLQLPSDLVEGPDGRLAMSGASGKAGDPQLPFVARSADGRSWERTILSDPQDEGYASAITFADGALYVAGVEADKLTIWTEQSADWQPEVIEPSGASISDLGWDPAVGLVAVGSKDGHYAVWLVREP